MCQAGGIPWVRPMIVMVGAVGLALKDHGSNCV